MKPSAILALGLLAAGGYAPAQVLRVPSPYTTIAAALAAAPANATILVAPGNYNELLTWPSVDGIRLIGVGGHLRTKIDALQAGRPLTFTSSAVTRKTLVEGFQITGGLLTSSNFNGGAGVYIDFASPTLRNNRITGNVADGTGRNYGGGIHVTGNGYPLITGNLIDNNELRNGTWNDGAGIYIGVFGRADLVGNTIAGNKNLSPANAPGNRGNGAGIYAEGAHVLIASNLVIANENKVTAWNYGGGIAANMWVIGTMTIVNNTLAGNKCTGGIWAHGAGLYLTGSNSNGKLVVAGNIIANNNAGGGSSQGAGGVHASSLAAALTLDWNDVWQNIGGDYNGIPKGANDVAVDPRFAGVGNYDLAPGSTLIDAMPATYLPAVVGVDYQGGSRRIDGNRDGITGDGARLDIGADEFADSVLTLSAPLQIGSVPRLQVAAGTLGSYALLLDFTEGNYLIEPFGNLLLSPLCIVIASGTTPADVPLPIPDNQALAGLTGYFQAVTISLANPSVGMVTNVRGATVF